MKLCFSLDNDNGDDDEKDDSDDDSKNDGGRKTVVIIKMVKCILPSPDTTCCLTSTLGILNIKNIFI